MKPIHLFLSRTLLGMTTLMVGGSLRAAPLIWFPATVLNEARSGAATVITTGGSIMMFGGNPVGSTNVLVFEGSDAQGLPVARVAPGAVALSSGQYFVYGGSASNSAKGASSSVYNYNPYSPGPDPEEPNIFRVTSMITARYDMAYASDAAGHAYAIGGLGRTTNVLASVEQFDPVATNWTNVASLPVGTYHFGAVFDGTNTIYAFGGRTNANAGGEIATVLAYSVSGNAWSTLAPLPVATAGSAAFKGPDGNYYVIGGTAGGVATNLVQVYNPGSNTWALSTPLPVGVTAAGGASDTLGRLVVLGGADGSNSNQATTWVSQQLSLPDAAPVFTSSGRTVANCLVPYTYTAMAGGSPPATYQLLTAPAGMQIDYYGGVVTWTPQVSEFGTNLVTIQASNYSGIATQTFSINAKGPPLTAPTNFVATNITETSYTLSWDPVYDALGPVTYQLYQVTFVHSPRGSGGGYVYGLIVSNITTTSITLTGLTPGTGHTYAVNVTAGGVTSAYSAMISAATYAPQPPQNLRLTDLTSTSTSLAWDPSPGPVPIVSYSVVDFGSNTAVTNAAGLTNTYLTITGQVPGSYHYYEVFAYDAAGRSSSPSGVGATYLIVWNPLSTPATISSAVSTGSGGFQFAVQTDWIRTTWVQATTDLTDPNSWVTIATNPPTSSSTYTFTDNDAGLYPMRFYRVVSP